jgi:hypothetical protein
VQKKSQLTIFAVLAVVLLVGASFMFMLVESPEDAIALSAWGEVKSYVDSCLQRTLQQGAFFIAVQGGYYEAPHDSFSYESVRIPYYHYYQNGPSMPTLERIEGQLSDYITNELPSCLDDFTSLKQQGYDISVGEMDAVATIAQNDVSVALEYPLVVSRGADSIRISAFAVNIPLDFSKKYDIVKDIIAKQQEEPNYSPIGYLALSAYDNTFFFETADLPDSTVVYALIFNETEKFNDLFVYAFAAKYDWSNLTSDEQKKVSLEPIVAQEAYVGYPFTYAAKAKGNNVRFTDFTSLFDIDPLTGTFTFTPTHEQGGSHVVIIKAEDTEGNSDTMIFELEVKGFSRPPIIESIPDFTIAVGQPFFYIVKATDEDDEAVLLLDNSTLFDINPLTGEISFTPTAISNHHIKITATDTRGLSDIEEFEIIVR